MVEPVLDLRRPSVLRVEAARLMMDGAKWHEADTPFGENELVLAPRGGMGIEGEPFPTWSSPIPIDAWVLAEVGTELLVWGPRLRLDPAFADVEIALLGRADFFRAFTVTFQEHAATPVYHLDAA